MTSEHERHITTTKTPGGWKIELDNDIWVLLMSALKLCHRPGSARWAR